MITYCRSRMTVDPRIPTMPGRSPSSFHRPGRHRLHQAQSAVRMGGGWIVKIDRTWENRSKRPVMV